MLSGWNSVPTYVDVIAECHCGHRSILDRRMPGVHSETLLVDVRDRCRCSKCGRRGAKRLLLRKMQR
jgi:hypothetical protein